MADDLMIVKANSLVEASYSMTLDEMRVLSLTLGVFDPLNPKRGFEFTVAEFCKHFPDVNPDIAYVQVQNAIRKISSRWMTLQNDDRVLHEVAFVTDRIYFKKEGRFYIEFHEKLLPYIANLQERYTKYELIHIGAFASTHTVRLYELCSQYRNIGHREVLLSELKNWLQVADKYERWNNFKARVLDPAVKEINEKSDLLISVTPIRRGRSIVSLDFMISPKKSAVKLLKSGRPKFPHKNKYGKYVTLNKQNPKMSNEAYGRYALDCLGILDGFYGQISDVSDEDLRNYWVFLAVNASHLSKIGTRSDFLDEIRKRGYKIENCELVRREETNGN